MRTTLNIDGEVLDSVRQFSEQRRISLGEAESFLLRRGLTVMAPHEKKNGFAMFSVDPGAPSFGLKDDQGADLKDDEELGVSSPNDEDGVPAGLP